jgi:sugar lactone lactonase YvrE
MPNRREFLCTLTASAIAARRVSAQRKSARIVAGIGRTANPNDDLWTEQDALKTPVSNPFGIIAGADGALYYCEYDTGCTRRLDLASNRVTTLAGNSKKAYTGDGGPALSASFSAPHEIRFDAAGNLFVVERDAHVVRRVDARTRVVSTVAGTGVAGFSGDGGPATAAQLRQPHSIAFGADGNLFVCDIGNQRVRLVNLKTGAISTYAGTGDRGPTPDDAPLEGTPLNGPRSIDTDPAGNIYLVLREGNAVFRIDPKAGRLTRIAGTGQTGFTGDGGPAAAATFNGPKGITYAPDQSLYIVDTENHAIRRVDLKSGTMTTVVGTGQRGNGPDGDPLKCALARPHAVAVHRGGLYVTDSENHCIRVVQ